MFRIETDTVSLDVERHGNPVVEVPVGQRATIRALSGAPEALPPPVLVEAPGDAMPSIETGSAVEETCAHVPFLFAVSLPAPGRYRFKLGSFELRFAAYEAGAAESVRDALRLLHPGKPPTETATRAALRSAAQLPWFDGTRAAVEENAFTVVEVSP